jgi:hypothetical protein
VTKKSVTKKSVTKKSVTKKSVTKKSVAKQPAARTAAPRRTNGKSAGPTPIDVGGIPCFIEDRGGPLLFGMTFRVGYADEAMTTRGLTHLVEHLSLFEASSARLPVNGSVAATETNLMVRGTPEEVTAFARSVCAALRSLPAARIEAESRVLRTEGASRPRWSLGGLLVTRFGTNGYGLATLPELGLVQPDPDTVQAWADRWFTADNVVLWATGPLPTDLEVDLRSGTRVAPPTPAPLSWKLPAWYTDSPSVVGLSFLIPRSDAGTMAARLLERRAHDRLRLEQGNSYDVSVWIDHWTSEHAHGIVAADTLADHAGAVRDGLLAELGLLATNPPSAEELVEQIALAERGWRDHDAAAGIASAQASNLLTGSRVRSVEQAVADLRTVTPDQITSAARGIIDSALFQVPNAAPAMPDRRFSTIPPGSPREVVGTSFPRARVLDDRSGRDQLVVGDAGVSFVISPTERITVLVSEATAVQRWSDGAQTWWAADGLCVFVHPEEWKGGEDALRRLTAMAPADRVVDMHQEAGSAYLDEINRRAAASPARKGLARLRRR